MDPMTREWAPQSVSHAVIRSVHDYESNRLLLNQLAAWTESQRHSQPQPFQQYRDEWGNDVSQFPQPHSNVEYSPATDQTSDLFTQSGPNSIGHFKDAQIPEQISAYFTRSDYDSIEQFGQPGIPDQMLDFFDRSGDNSIEHFGEAKFPEQMSDYFAQSGNNSIAQFGQAGIQDDCQPYNVLDHNYLSYDVGITPCPTPVESQYPEPPKWQAPEFPSQQHFGHSTTFPYQDFNSPYTPESASEFHSPEYGPTAVTYSGYESDLDGCDKSDGSSKRSTIPYAHLIYEALMQAPSHQLVLKDIYAWFKENCERAQDLGSTGWMNSVRHNLSMNEAFQKLPYSSSADDDKVSYIWMLDKSAVGKGVQPTTRYRSKVDYKKSTKRRARPPPSSGRITKVAKKNPRARTVEIIDLESPTSFQSRPVSLQSTISATNGEGPEMNQWPALPDPPRPMSGPYLGSSSAIQQLFPRLKQVNSRGPSS